MQYDLQWGGMTRAAWGIPLPRGGTASAKAQSPGKSMSGGDREARCSWGTESLVTAVEPEKKEGGIWAFLSAS